MRFNGKHYLELIFC